MHLSSLPSTLTRFHAEHEIYYPLNAIHDWYWFFYLSLARRIGMYIRLVKGSFVEIIDDNGHGKFEFVHGQTATFR